MAWRISRVILQIARNIASIRKYEEMSLEELSKKSNLDNSTLVEIESGMTMSTVGDLLAISNALGRDLPSLLNK